MDGSNPKVPGNPWNMAEKLLLNPRVDGFFYWLVKGNAHYGRFTEVERPGSNSAYLDVVAVPWAKSRRLR